ATPDSVDNCRANRFSAYLSSSYSGMESDCMPRNMMGASAGLTLSSVGGIGMLNGSGPPSTWSAACTSSAAPSISRSRSNWMVTVVVPDEDCDVIDDTPAMVENCDSSGVATALAL